MIQLLETQMSHRGINLAFRNLSQDERFRVGRRVECVHLGVKKDALERFRQLQSGGIIPIGLRIRQESIKNINDGGQFVAISSKTSPLNEPYFIKIRRIQPSANGEKAQFYEKPTDIEGVNIITNFCLFGVGKTEATLVDHSKVSFTDSTVNIYKNITNIAIDPALSLYEVEALSRLSNWINTITEDNPTYKGVIINTPRVGYYLFGLTHFVEGRMSADTLLAWFKEVNKRSDRISSLTTQRINPQLDITIKPPLNEIEQYLQGTVRDGNIPQLPDALTILAEDPIWKIALQQKVPDTWLELNDFSESVEELRGILTASNHRAVVIKSPNQEGVFSTTERLLKGVPQLPPVYLVGMFPHEEVVVTHLSEDAKPALYHIHDYVSFTNAREIIKKIERKSFRRSVSISANPDSFETLNRVLENIETLEKRPFPLVARDILGDTIDAIATYHALELGYDKERIHDALMAFGVELNGKKIVNSISELMEKLSSFDSALSRAAMLDAIQVIQTIKTAFSDKCLIPQLGLDQ